LETVNIFAIMVQPKLSQLQRQLLCALLRDTNVFEGWSESTRVEAATVGVPYRAREWFTPSRGWRYYPTPTSASLSRALARLEERGLLVRANIHTGADAAGAAPVRTTHVRLTEEGRAVADELFPRKKKRLT
jgi:hypothetical protein